MMQNERAYLFTTMRELVQQQLMTLSESTSAELDRVVARINAVSDSCDEHLSRMQSNYKTYTSTLQDVKQELVKGVACDRLSRLEEDRASLQETTQLTEAVQSRLTDLAAEHDVLTELLSA